MKSKKPKTHISLFPLILAFGCVFIKCSVQPTLTPDSSRKLPLPSTVSSTPLKYKLDMNDSKERNTGT